MREVDNNELVEQTYRGRTMGEELAAQWLWEGQPLSHLGVELKNIYLEKNDIWASLKERVEGKVIQSVLYV